ncbi:MAG: beta-ketoacyl-[acyl-carrier-protein] synthase family protein [Chloroflexota bacterium]
MPQGFIPGLRVVVAGLGAITPFGPTADDLWEGVRTGTVAIRRVRQIATQGYGTRVAAEVPPGELPEHDYRRPRGHREPAIDFALLAAEEALAGCGFEPDRIAGDRWAVVVGTCNAGLESAESWYLAENSWAVNPASPLLLVPPQALAEALSGAFGIRGPVISLNTACAAGANAIGYAADLIRSGHADAVLAGASDALSEVAFAGFSALEALSPEAAAPYSLGRRGLSLGEGSAMLVLVRHDLAQSLGVKALAEVAGYGLSADGYNPTAPHPEGEGAARAIRAAMADAGVAPKQVAYVNGHGTGTPKNDSAETNAIRLALGDAANGVLVSSTKSMIGHLLGAAGAVEAAVTIKALGAQVAPPTANFDIADPECDLDYVSNVARPVRMDVALSNNFAFGGANACLALARPGILPPPPGRSPERVVVTGIATLTCAGSDPAAAWAALDSGASLAAGVDGPRRGRLEINPADHMSPREARRLDRLSLFAVAAARLSLRDADLEVGPHNRAAIGVLLGTGLGPLESLETFLRPLLEEGPAAANPAIFPNTVSTAAAGYVGIHCGAVGPTSTITAGHAAGAAALCYARDMVAWGRAQAMVGLAVDALSDIVVDVYRRLRIMRGSFWLSEAAIGLVLESLDSARSRGARIYGELLGYGVTSDARGIAQFDRDGDGIERAARLALERSGLRTGDLTDVFAGFRGHQAADAAERAALARLGATGARLHAPGLVLGEPGGAGGSLSAALALHAGADLALINASSLGGTSVSLVLRGGAPA